MDKFNILDFEIDKLTNSIENTRTGEVFDTEIIQITSKNSKFIKQKDWQFNWKQELLISKRQVFKLTSVNNFAIIQGLLSIEDKQDHIFMHLLENAKFNIGQDKMYLGVAGNLVAFACKVAFEKGYDGYIAFDAKTELIKHYEKSLNATLFRGQRMFIEEEAAEFLVSKYFKN
jgi:hypothetical protein